MVCIWGALHRFSGAETAFRRALVAAEAALAPRSLDDANLPPIAAPALGHALGHALGFPAPSAAGASDAGAAPEGGLAAAADESAEGTEAAEAGSETDALDGAASSSGDDADASNDAQPLPPLSSARSPPRMPPLPPEMLSLSLLSLSPPRLHGGKGTVKLRHSDALLAALSGLARALYRQVTLPNR